CLNMILPESRYALSRIMPYFFEHLLGKTGSRACRSCSASWFEHDPSKNRYPDHALVRTQHLDLPRPLHFHPWSGPRLDPTANANPFILEGLRDNSGAHQVRQRAPRNSHREVPCPVTSEVQKSCCPGLPHGQHLALDYRKSPDPGQNIVRTFRVFYGGRARPDAALARPRLRFRGKKAGRANLVGDIGRYQPPA